MLQTYTSYSNYERNGLLIFQYRIISFVPNPSYSLFLLSIPLVTVSFLFYPSFLFPFICPGCPIAIRLLLLHSHYPFRIIIYFPTSSHISFSFLWLPVFSALLTPHYHRYTSFSPHATLSETNYLNEDESRPVCSAK